MWFPKIIDSYFDFKKQTKKWLLKFYIHLYKGF